MEKSSKLTYTERLNIQLYISKGFNPAQIAKKLERSRSTITRELNKWCDNKQFYEYEAVLAHNYTREGIRISHRGEFKLNKHPKLLKLVLKKLTKRWSPQQISGWLRRHFPKDKSMNVSHETIYQYIYTVAKGELRKILIENLRQGKKKRKSRAGMLNNRSLIKDRVSIDERPSEVDDRIVPGHWESDLIIGSNHKSAIGTLVERKTKYLIMVPLKNKTTHEVCKAFAKEFRKLPKELKKSMTHDNGLELAAHKLFTKETEMQVYFCHPYSSWERGTNENTNGLIRDFYPKGTDFNMYTRKEIKEVQKLLNERPRKILNFATPAEVFNECILQSKY